MVSLRRCFITRKKYVCSTTLSSLRRYQQAELINGRTAMTAVAGAPLTRDRIVLPGVSKIIIAGQSIHTFPSALTHSAVPASPLQLASKTGVINVPEWYDAGKLYYETTDPLPFGEAMHAA